VRLALVDRALERIAHGDAQARVALSGDDEVAHLGQAFNRMADQLAASRQELESARQFTAGVIRSASEGILVAVAEGTVVLANPAAATLLGRPAEELHGCALAELIDPAADEAPLSEAEGAASRLDLILGGAQRRQIKAHARRSDGGQHPIVVNASPLREGPAIRGVVIAFNEVSELQRAEEAARQQAHQLLRLNRELQRRSEEQAGLGRLGDLLQSCMSFDEAYGVIHEVAGSLFAPAAGALYLIGSSRNVAEAVTMWGAWADGPVFAPEECWALRRGQDHLVLPGPAASRCRHATARADRTQLCVPLVAQGEAIGMLSLCADGAADERLTADGFRAMARTAADTIALALANLRLREKLQHQSIRDPHTGLFNRRYLEEILEREIRRAQRGGSPLSLILFDIDHFKRFNDTFGHEAGDLVLREVGALLRDDCRDSDIPCRYGGEELVLGLPDTDLHGAWERAERLRRAIKQLQLVHRGRALGGVSISAGIASFPEHGESPEQLLRLADHALYRAKGEGRDRVVIAPQDGAAPDQHAAPAAPEMPPTS
jgi:diguanylate cyclase (GGDEF)-like protein/PAS domain S-box-containing protein